jgi:hypothetical protein
MGIAGNSFAVQKCALAFFAVTTARTPNPHLRVLSSSRIAAAARFLAALLGFFGAAGLAPFLALFPVVFFRVAVSAAPPVAFFGWRLHIAELFFRRV